MADEARAAARDRGVVGRRLGAMKDCTRVYSALIEEVCKRNIVFVCASGWFGEPLEVSGISKPSLSQMNPLESKNATDIRSSKFSFLAFIV